MNTLDMAIYAATAAALGGLALALFRSDGLSLRLGALGAFAVFYVAMVLWAPVDQAWGNLTIGGVLVVALLSRMKKPAGAAPSKEEDVQ
jgi:hypothetical protein